MPGWRREFIKLFPQHQSAAQAETYSGALVQQPLFFILKEAIILGETDNIKRVISYVKWLDQNPAASCTAEIEEDLFIPIAESRDLRTGLLKTLNKHDFESIKKYFIASWQSEEHR
ncbi:hypothetical protein HNE05_16230 [Aquipseudomonas campi]|uniref:Uncharacterized protein n=1 Tax=Aquipseudomonas campi TaxID=2731681 RepID=A0A6M8FBW4_9GAMM|nr:hypothetical protein [Pseudomonas campi]QKE64831.1 hypothetical protein HNE05_16230 [Pseudomonas campi]